MLRGDLISPAARLRGGLQLLSVSSRVFSLLACGKREPPQQQLPLGQATVFWGRGLRAHRLQAAQSPGLGHVPGGEGLVLTPQTLSYLVPDLPTDFMTRQLSASIHPSSVY